MTREHGNRLVELVFCTDELLFAKETRLTLPQSRQEWHLVSQCIFEVNKYLFDLNNYLSTGINTYSTRIKIIRHDSIVF